MALQLLTDSKEVGSPNLQIRWCVSKDDLTKLRELQVPTDMVFVLIVVAYSNGMEDRYLVPLESAMTYIGLSYPGTHKLIGKVVFPLGFACGEESKKYLKKMKTRLLATESPHIPKFNTLNYEKTEFDNLHSESLGISYRVEAVEGFSTNLEVDKRLFAPEPPAWLKRWVNLCFRYKTVDQCHFRKRLPFALILQPIPVALYSVLLVLRNILIWLYSQGVLGIRGVNMSLLLHPWKTTYNDFFPKKLCRDGDKKVLMSTSWYMHDAEGNEEPLRLFRNPVVLFGLSGFVYMIYLWIIVASTLKLTLVGVLLLLVFTLLKYGHRIMDYHDNRQANPKKVTPEKNKNQKAGLAWDMEYSKLQQYLACSVVKKMDKPVSLASIPRQQRTIRLRFLDVKARVCRPFAG